MCRWIDGDGSVDLWTDGWETIVVLPSSPKTVDVNDSAVDGNSDCDVVAVAVFLFSSIGCRDGYLTPRIRPTSGLNSSGCCYPAACSSC